MYRDKTFTVMHNAIDTEKFRFDPIKREKIRKEFGIENKVVVGHVGRMCFQKNQNRLVDIFNEFQKIQENAVLMMIGDGPDEEMIRMKVKMLGIEDKVIMLKKRNDVADLYQAMDVFCLPSRYEGLPVVGVEAQASGLPCLFSSSVTEETGITENAQFVQEDVPPEI